MIRVLIAEDAAVTREYLAYLIGQDPALQLVGQARDGREAVELAERLRPDVILMDIHMPEINGFEATRAIMAHVPTPIVVMSASLEPGDVAKSFAALSAGALTLVAKPAWVGDPAQPQTVRELLQTVKLMAEVRVVRRWERHAAVPPAIDPRPRHIRLVAIGASTGGPPVLAEILRGMRGALSVPVVVAQHITPGFVGGLADWLRTETGLPVRLGKAGESVRPGTVYLGPDGLQMGLAADGCIRLSADAVENGFRPSISHLFRSVAAAYGRAAVGVLLTGMGRDGATGLRCLRDAGALTIVQDEPTSVVFGMPGEAIALGAAEYTLPPAAIAQALRGAVAAR